MAFISKLFNLILFAVVSAVFLPMIAIVHVCYGPWEKWFENIAKS